MSLIERPYFSAYCTAYARTTGRQTSRFGIVMYHKYKVMIVLIAVAICTFIVERITIRSRTITDLHSLLASGVWRPSRTTTVYRYDGTQFQQLQEFCTWTLHMDCVELKTGYGLTPIYIHDVSVDRWVSGNVKKTGTWEPGNIQLIVSLLKKDPELGFMDLGSHMGVFSLSVAKFGRKVVSVDPLIENVQRLCKSVQKGGFTENVTIIFNPLSDKHTVVNFKREVGNIGGTSVEESKVNTNSQDNSYTVTLDDLLPFLPFKKAILKMDVQEHEYHVLNGSSKFFTHIKVPAILMEWHLLKLTADGQKVVKLLTGYNFKAYEPKINGMKLDPKNYKTWPYDIIWIRS